MPRSSRHEDQKRRKLQWYGHVSRSSGLAKTILQGTVKQGRRQGRQRKRWEDNIREWTGLESGKSQRAVENREKWRKLVAKSSVVPQRPSRLRDDNDEKSLSNIHKHNCTAASVSLLYKCLICSYSCQQNNLIIHASSKIEANTTTGSRMFE